MSNGACEAFLAAPIPNATLARAASLAPCARSFGASPTGPKPNHRNALLGMTGTGPIEHQLSRSAPARPKINKITFLVV